MTAPVAIVTGASSGLGRALACELAAAGYAVGLIARRESLLQETCVELRANGHSAMYATADVTELASITAAVDRLRAELGGIDLVIANAGIRLNDMLDPFDPQFVEKSFSVNLMGVVNVIAAVLPEMTERGSGHIVGISSLGADRGLPGSAAYGASKAALNTYLEGLRVSLRPRGIAVTTVCPGFIRTEMTVENDFMMPWLMEPEAAARRIVRALRRRPAVYRFPWGTSLLMRSLRILPDWLIARLPQASARTD